MKEDFQKFMELAKTDEALQKKLEEAGKNYDGPQTEEAAFHAIIEPIAKEAGFTVTLADCKPAVQELSLDEMAQVAGGGGYGASIGGCMVIGVGAGGAGGHDTGRDTYGGQACALFGLGYGSTKCWGSGEVEAWEISTGGRTC